MHSLLPPTQINPKKGIYFKGIHFDPKNAGKKIFDEIVNKPVVCEGMDESGQRYTYIYVSSRNSNIYKVPLPQMNFLSIFSKQKELIGCDDPGYLAIKEIFQEIILKMEATQAVIAFFLEKGRKIDCLDTAYQVGNTLLKNKNPETREKDRAIAHILLDSTGLNAEILEEIKRLNNGNQIFGSGTKDMLRSLLLASSKLTISRLLLNPDFVFERLKMEMKEKIMKLEEEKQILKDDCKDKLNELFLAFSQIREKYGIPKATNHDALFKKYSDYFPQQKILFHKLEKDIIDLHDNMVAPIIVKNLRRGIRTEAEKKVYIQNAQKGLQISLENMLAAIRILSHKYGFDPEASSIEMAGKFT